MASATKVQRYNGAVWTTGKTAVLKGILPEKDGIPRQTVNGLEIAGIITTDEEDFKHERVSQTGADMSYLSGHGWFTDNHRDGSADIVGYPTKVEKIRMDDGREAHAVRGYLFDDPQGRAIYNKMKLAQSIGRPFGFSIEGVDPVRENGRMTSVRVVNVAITPAPVNLGTVAWALKGMQAESGGAPGGAGGGLTAGYAEPDYSGGGSGAALVPQSLERRLAVATIGGREMAGDIKAAVGKFLEGLTDEEKEELKAQLGANAAPSPDAAAGVAPGPAGVPGAPGGVPGVPGAPGGVAKGIDANAPGVSPVPDAGTPGEAIMQAANAGKKTDEPVDPNESGEDYEVKEFLEGLVTHIGDKLDGVTKALEQLHGKFADKEKKDEEVMKSLRNDLARAPGGVAKGVSFGGGQAPAPTVATDVRKDPLTLRSVMTAALTDTAKSMNQRLMVGDLLVRMESGHFPSDKELSAAGFDVAKIG